MPLFKNTASQKIPVYAYDTSVAKTGDAANITGSISKDGAASAAITDTNPTEIGGGWYLFDLTQAESNANLLAWFGASSTDEVKVEGGVAFTVEGVGGLQSVDIGTINGDMVDPVPTLENSLPYGTTTGTPTTTTVTLSGDDILAGGNYSGRYLWVLEGPQAGTAKKIIAYDGPSKTVTTEIFPEALGAGVAIRILPEKPS